MCLADRWSKNSRQRWHQVAGNSGLQPLTSLHVAATNAIGTESSGSSFGNDFPRFQTKPVLSPVFHMEQRKSFVRNLGKSLPVRATHTNYLLPYRATSYVPRISAMVLRLLRSLRTTVSCCRGGGCQECNQEDCTTAGIKGSFLVHTCSTGLLLGLETLQTHLQASLTSKKV